MKKKRQARDQVSAAQQWQARARRCWRIVTNELLRLASTKIEFSFYSFVSLYCCCADDDIFMSSTKKKFLREVPPLHRLHDEMCKQSKVNEILRDERWVSRESFSCRATTSNFNGMMLRRERSPLMLEIRLNDGKSERSWECDITDDLSCVRMHHEWRAAAMWSTRATLKQHRKNMVNCKIVNDSRSRS